MGLKMGLRTVEPGFVGAKYAYRRSSIIPSKISRTISILINVGLGGWRQEGQEEGWAAVGARKDGAQRETATMNIITTGG